MRGACLHSHTPSWRGASIKDRNYFTLPLYNPVWNLSLGTVGIVVRGAVAQLVEAVRYKPEGGGFDSRWGNWDFSLT
jgi:hypothetical protein